ncbi:hypothetical protein AB0C33_01675 [Nonomuraea sp. NPDC048881]|uniref:hypothetical protein n=1 Tax=unclassified Nonomuraea TaxID=2593643 RepID=UPI0034027776
MSKTTLIWSAVSGALLALLVGVVAGLLATGNGSTVAGAIMAGATASGGFAALWITGTSAVHTWLNSQKPETPSQDTSG